MSKLQAQIVNVRTVSGTGKTGKAYSFQVCEAVIVMPDNQSRTCQFNVDSKQPIEGGKRYEIEFVPSIGQNSKLEWRVGKVTGQAAAVAKVA